jgi:AraC family transcriptional regulator
MKTALREVVGTYQPEVRFTPSNNVILAIAVDYMEENLLTPISCDTVAEHVYISSFHFQRTFTALTGFPVGEYIRNRRLSLAGQDLLNSNVKIIDTALKYSYETPESFTKAFKRFHGISPVQARKEGVSLKSFNHMHLKLILEGGTTIDYSIVKKDAFEVVVISRNFLSQNCGAEIPLFWQEYKTTGLINKVCGEFGIRIFTEYNTEEFEYCIGCQTEYANEITEQFKRIIIPSYTWAVFKCVGPIPITIQQMWCRIYTEWLPQAKYEFLNTCDIEYYTYGNINSPDYYSEIWIPVKEKPVG